jgi:hypothetical protein
MFCMEDSAYSRASYPRFQHWLDQVKLRGKCHQLPLNSSERLTIMAFYRVSIRSYPPVFSANLEEMSLVFSLVGVGLPLVLDRPFYPVYPGFENTSQHFLIDSSEHFGNRVQKALQLSQLYHSHQALFMPHRCLFGAGPRVV